MPSEYVHGYTAFEEARLTSQATILAEFIHARSKFAPGSRILEPGCGTGAQTMQLAARNPQVRIVSVDRSAESLQIVAHRLKAQSLDNVELRLADVEALPFGDGEFDGAFVCFVLEHLTARDRALAEIRRVLRPGARLIAFEGDHGATIGWPRDPAMDRLVAAVGEYQRSQGGDACMGRALGPVLTAAGFRNVTVEPCVAYADTSRPEWVEGFTKATFIDMMRGQRDAVLRRDLLTESEWNAGIAALERTTAPDGSFSYSFYRARAER